ncbi:TPA: N-6 DNA methylase [Pseudomonas aeruginosa]|uniref:HsdM family class I SAM-dependent methyltransferase n=1 Tax=Pseudomonas aeruginosa TaxID=287 RepID=UPI002AFADDB6|nr:N-6 DNA methylase [Pseudomonas aeruginosa]HBO8979344.1 N-6 DNA methylase [Pseudomonas aeruginosa]HEO1557912.1 N-6 DNA methylase [Pseudomonas aeruginosa]
MRDIENWLSQLSYTEFPEELFQAGKAVGTRQYAAEIEEILSPNGSIGASAVFCVGEQPTICFFDSETLEKPQAQRIEQIRQRIWNQNLASVVIVVDSESLAAYSVSDRDAEPDRLINSDASRDGHWSAFEVQSGFIKDRLSDWFSPEERVDQRLLANLRAVVKKLGRDGLTESQAEALMAQVIFLCYLEQREIIGEAYRNHHQLELLETYVSRRDGQEIDRLLSQLSKDFNGDFLSSTDGGAPKWSALGNNAFLAIKQFLEAVDIDTGQGSFWRYDFSHIPVELISGIYETLLKDRQGALGAYYTPRHLANLVTEQAFQPFKDPSTCTVYDGACGSGILLTTAFRRMLRYAEVRQGRSLRFAERVSLMRDTIFGNDIDETACWITAFSLYLSLLEGLEKSDILLLQTDANLKLPKLVGPGLNIQKGIEHGDFFSCTNPFAGKRKFDIFLCNPPWRESDNGENPTWEEWCRQQEPPYPIGRRQIAAGFAYRSMHSVKPGGVIALIMPLNLIVGATAQSCTFRQRLLEEAKIERIINFCDIRRLLFPAAKHPCAVVRARPRPSEEESISLTDETIEYWAPKTDVSLALGRLALHSVDMKLLRAHEVYEKPYLLISSYWGEYRDISLLKRLQRLGTVSTTMTTRPSPWLSAKGFHAPNSSNPDRTLGPLENLAYLPADRLPSAYPIIAGDAQLGKVKDYFSIVASPGGRNAKLYDGPRVIFPDGLTDGYAVRAVYTETPFAFTSSIGVIGGERCDADLLKLLAVYLRSPLVSYLMVMTGYSVIGERPRIALDDIEAFPFCSPERHPTPQRAAEIVSSVSSLLSELEKTSEWQRDIAYNNISQQLNNLIYDYFQLTSTERILVEDIVQVVTKSIQPANYQRLTTPLLHRPQKDEVQEYLSELSKELSHWRERSSGKGALEIHAVVHNEGGFFGAIQVRMKSGSNDSVELTTTKIGFHKMLGELHKSLGLHASTLSSDELFRIPNIMVLSGDSFYFVKPLRRRFWMRRTALTDADLIVQTVRSAAWRQVYQ